jgi:hypothetical protein
VDYSMDDMGLTSTRYTIDEEDGLLKYAPTMAEFEAQLQKYNGSLTRWLVSGRLVVSPGVRYVLNTSGGWAINAIIEFQKQEQIKQIGHQFWTLQFNAAGASGTSNQLLGRATLTCKTYSDDGDSIIVVHESVYENVEFPAAELEMLVVDDGPDGYITFYLDRED